MVLADRAWYLPAMDQRIDPQHAAWLEAKFEEFARMVSSAFQRMEDHINARFDQLEERVDRLKERMGRLEERMGRLEEAVARLEERVSRLEGTVARL